MSRKTKDYAKEPPPIDLALNEKVEHFRLLTKLSPVALCLNGPDGEIDYLNDRFTATFGYTIEDMPTVDVSQAGEKRNSSATMLGGQGRPTSISLPNV
jgi:PAS domain S-box-containing protein